MVSLCTCTVCVCTCMVVLLWWCKWSSKCRKYVRRKWGNSAHCLIGLGNCSKHWLELVSYKVYIILTIEPQPTTSEQSTLKNRMPSQGVGVVRVALFCVYMQVHVSLAAPGPTWIRRYSHATINQPFIHQSSALSRTVKQFDTLWHSHHDSEYAVYLYVPRRRDVLTIVKHTSLSGWLRLEVLAF